MEIFPKSTLASFMLNVSVLCEPPPPFFFGMALQALRFAALYEAGKAGVPFLLIWRLSPRELSDVLRMT